MADEGESGNLFRKREEAFTISTYMSNRDDLIRFYSDLARMTGGKIPAEMKSDDGESSVLLDAQKNLDSALRLFSDASAKMSKDDLSAAVARLCLAMFVLERVRKLREITLAADNLGVFSLYVTLRNRAGKMLSEPFFSSSPQKMLGAWLDIEPLLNACSGLCNLAVPELRAVMDEYQPRVADAVAKLEK